MSMVSTLQCTLLLLMFSFFCYANCTVEPNFASENEVNTHGKLNKEFRRIRVDDHDREAKFIAFFSPKFNNPFFKKPPLPLMNHIPNSFPILKKPFPIPTLKKKPLPFPLFNKPIPKSIPIFAKPTPKSSPVTKKPLPVPVLKKPVPKSIPIVKPTPKPISKQKQPCPIKPIVLNPIPFLKPIPKPYSIGKRPIPIPVFKKPLQTPFPFFKKPFPIPEKPFLPPLVPDLKSNPFFKNHIPKLPPFPYKFKHPLFPPFPTQEQMTTP